MNSRRSAAFLSLDAYPLFDDREPSRIGGMETRSALFARALAQTGRWRTCFAVKDHGQGKSTTIDSVELIAFNPLAKRIRDNVVPRFQKHKWRPVVHLDSRDIAFLWQLPAYMLMRCLPQYLINGFWRRLHPDVVCCFGNNPVTAETIADCRRSGIKTLLCIASDDDLSPNYKAHDRRPNDYGTPRWMARYAIDKADFVMVQTERQQKLLAHFGRIGTIIRNPVRIPEHVPQSWRAREDRRFALWIGRSDNFHKRPQLLHDLARACPEVRFVMIVNRTNAHIYDDLERNIPANVEMIERIPHREIWDYYSRARLFVSTSASAYEGFPNTFLQAAVSGTPVVSLAVDPEGILSSRGCGLCASDHFAGFVESVRRVWSDEGLADKLAENFLAFARENYDLEKISEHFEALLEGIVAAPPEAPSPGCWSRPFRRFI